MQSFRLSLRSLNIRSSMLASSLLSTTAKRPISLFQGQGALTTSVQLVRTLLTTSSLQPTHLCPRGVIRALSSKVLNPLTEETPAENMAVDRLRGIWNEHYENWDVRRATINQDPYFATCNIPGLDPSCFNIYGNPKVQKVLFSVLAARLYMYHKPSNANGDVFLDWSTVTTDRFTFLSSLETSFSRALYDQSLDRSRFDVKLSVVYVGSASLSVMTELYSKDLPDEPVITQVVTVVSVDLRTRKPTPFPDWFRDKFVDKGVHDHGLVLRPFQRPNTTFAYRLKVRWSDTDAYNHTNYASYITFAEDAIHSALKSIKSDSASEERDHAVAALTGLEVKMLQSGMKNLQISYQNESLEGQELVAHVWQTEEEGPCVVRCSIERGDTRVCQLRLEYLD